MIWVWLVFLAGVISVGVAFYFNFRVASYPEGNERMNYISSLIRQGAMAFLRREFSTLIPFIAIVALVIGLLLYEPSYPLKSWLTALSYIIGGFFSILASWIGMNAATIANVKTSQAATKGQSEALSVAFSGGAVMGLTIAGLGAVGLSLLFIFYSSLPRPEEIISGFSMGASSVALFARVGGGIYTKSADVGADLVGKIEAGIPEDDPRNPAVIADNVGDNVGDVAGMGADLFESYVGAAVATIALGAAVAASRFELMSYPLFLIALGTAASVIASLLFKIFEKLNPAEALRYTTYLAGLLTIVGSFALVKVLGLETGVFWATVAGIIAGMVIGGASEYYTSGSPIVEIARSATTGAATNIITGLAIGMLSTILPVVAVCAGVFIAAKLTGSFNALYGIAVAGVGMLSTIGITMSVDAYGPIADNAGGIAEMSHLGKEIREITDGLDALGNTTAAIGKGFAIGSAALTALAFLAAYTSVSGLAQTGINLTKFEVVIGLFLGGCMPFLFAALTMQAVGRTAYKIVEEVRRQFREIKGLLEGKADPDPATCVDITTRSAIKEMIAPGVLALVVPLVVGILLGPEALGGFLAGAILVGFFLALMMANAGGAWDNAKKYIEKGELGGKGSEAHKAAVVGDTVGDPFKDTSGPSMNILIKLMSVVSLVFAPFISRLFS